MDQKQIDEIRARCDKTIKDLRGFLPPMVDYADLVCADGPCHGMHYVWEDPEPYAMDAAASLIEELCGEIYRQAARVERLEAELDRYRQAEQDDCCDNCRFKLQSEAWTYYTYPCNECRHRVSDHFAVAEEALKEALP